MKKGIVSDAYTNKYGSLNTACKKMKEHGYDCLDYQNLIDTDNSYLYTLSDREFGSVLQEERKIIEACGLFVSQVHGPWRWPFHDTTAEERAERFEKMSVALHGCAILGSPYFIIHNIMPTGEKYSDPKAFIDDNLVFFSKLATVAKQEGVTICMENMPFPDQPIARPKDLLGFVKLLNRENVRMCLDTGHCSCLGISPADAVHDIGAEYLRTLHLHDNDGISDRHFMIYDGVTDWSSFAEALHEISYGGVLSLECSAPGSEDKAVQEQGEIELFERLCRLDLTL